MFERRDQEKHQSLVEELVQVLQQEGFLVNSADGIQGFVSPLELQNDGYGDQEDKKPDVYAYDQERKCYVIGEAKTGAGDFETEHALTQYNVFLDQADKRTGVHALLYVIVPASKVAEFNSLITHYIHREYWGNIVVVSSSRWTD
jgi:hypothetical protein